MGWITQRNPRTPSPAPSHHQDKSTGSSTINVPTLKHYLPELTDDMADRTLRSLQKKGYIYRKITYKSKPAYPYWVAGYEPTVGSLRARRLDLSEVLATKDISKLRYINPAAEGAAQPADEGAAEPADSNKKREERKQEQTKVLTVIEDGATISPASEIERKIENAVAVSAPVRAMAQAGDMVPVGSNAELHWSGERGEYLDWRKKPVPYDVAAAHIRKVHGLVREGNVFIHVSTGESIPCDLAHQIISGDGNVKEAA